MYNFYHYMVVSRKGLKFIIADLLIYSMVIFWLMNRAVHQVMLV